MAHHVITQVIHNYTALTCVLLMLSYWTSSQVCSSSRILLVTSRKCFDPSVQEHCVNLRSMEEMLPFAQPQKVCMYVHVRSRM